MKMFEYGKFLKIRLFAPHGHFAEELILKPIASVDIEQSIDKVRQHWHYAYCSVIKHGRIVHMHPDLYAHDGIAHIADVVYSWYIGCT